MKTSSSDEGLDINKVLANAAIIGIEKLSKKTQNKIRGIWLRKQYGITINPDEANKLKQISENPTYLLYKKCVGKNPYTPLYKNRHTIISS